jgi:hypothetical protein
MKKSFFIATGLTALLSAAFSTAAQGASVVIRDKRCLSASPARVHDVVVGYDRYSATPGAKYSVPVPLVGSMPMLAMIKSQSRFLTNNASGTDANVWVVLQPSTLSQAAYYPRFLIRCTSTPRGAGFQHVCREQRNVQHYGMDDFESTLDVVGGASECGGKTLMTYELRLTSNDREVSEIKDAVLAPAGPLAAVIGGFFDEESFFRNYYLNFYNGWVSTL